MYSMNRKSKVKTTIYIDRGIYMDLIKYVRSKHPDRIKPPLSAWIEKAITLMIRGGRGSSGRPPSRKKNKNSPLHITRLEKIISHLINYGYSYQFTLKNWEDACIATVGGTRKTIENYLHLAERLGRIRRIARNIWEVVE